MPAHPWIPSANKDEREYMLKRIGVSTPLDLYRDVPSNLLLDRLPKVGFGKALSEFEIQRIVESYLRKNRVFLDPPPFMGGGLCFHVVPAAVKYILSRGEFYTAYTPYQPEINQGLLQALFEYQSLIADLFEMDVVNASMYDMSTAVAEAFLMAVRVTKKKKILVPKTMHPEHLNVAKTWLLGKDIKIEQLSFDSETGEIDLADLERKLQSNSVAAVYVENPSSLGFIERNVETISDLAHKHGALLIAGVDPLSLGLIKPPGRYDADIAVGEGQSLGLGLNYGGPLLGIFAVKWDRRLIRQMPGRLIGLTQTVDGKERGFAMILQTREQHIKREKATSNITTNEALMAIAAAVYLSLLGREGIRKISRSIWLRSHYAAKRLSEIGVKAPYFDNEFFKEFVAVFPISYQEIHKALLEKNILGGLPLDKWCPWIGSNAALFCVTEAHSVHDIDLLVDTINEIVGRVKRA